MEINYRIVQFTAFACCFFIELLLIWEHFVMKDTRIDYPIGIVLVWSLSLFNCAVTAGMIRERMITTVHYTVFTAALTATSGCCHLLFTDTSGLILVILSSALAPTFLDEYRLSQALDQRLDAHRNYIPPHPTAEAVV
jgi:hypothetical protein